MKKNEKPYTCKCKSHVNINLKRIIIRVKHWTHNKKEKWGHM